VIAIAPAADAAHPVDESCAAALSTFAHPRPPKVASTGASRALLLDIDDRKPGQRAKNTLSGSLNRSEEEAP